MEIAKNLQGKTTAHLWQCDILNDLHSEYFFFCDLQLLFTLTNCTAGHRDSKMKKKYWQIPL